MEIWIFIVCIAVLVLCGVLHAFSGRDWRLDRGDSWGKSYQDEWGFGDGAKEERDE